MMVVIMLVQMFSSQIPAGPDVATPRYAPRVMLVVVVPRCGFPGGGRPATFSVEIATMARFSQSLSVSLSVASPWGKPRVPHRRDAHPG